MTNSDIRGPSGAKLPDVILLNGASSAGKSSLTLALQARLPFVRMGIDVFFVGVHCSAEELTLRASARRDRAPGAVLEGRKRVHAHATYDLEVDSTVTPSSALAAQIIAAPETRSGPSAFERLR